MKPRTLRRKLRIEAFFRLAIARFAVHFVSAQRLLVWAARAPRQPRRFANPDLPAQVAAAVNRVGSSRWMKTMCLPQALATQAMLRRRGISSRLCLGVAHDGRSLAAHAWVEIGHEIVIGETDAATGPAFTRVAQFG